MILSLAEIIIFGLITNWFFDKLKIPGLIGMLFVGIIIGPYAFNLLGLDILKISPDLRLIALIVILLRAGFTINKNSLNSVGTNALKLSFIPATFEAAAITFLAPYFLGLTYMESAILGCVTSAVSPAVVVPLMTNFIETKRGVKKGIPTMILAGASLDDMYAITMYSIFLSIYTGKNINLVWKAAEIPISILSGIAVGLLSGYILFHLFDHFSPRATKQVIIILGVSFFLTQIEKHLPFASLLAVITIGIIILEMRENIAHKISSKLSKIWIFAEILLFVLVGAQVNIPVAMNAGFSGLLLILSALISRSIGTYLCVIGTNLNFKERVFVVISYIPKATVQAAIGAAPLAAMKLAGMNTGPGEIILAIAVLSIIVTAPVGAWAISFFGEKFLELDC